jgi:hypothetical protein
MIAFGRKAAVAAVAFAAVGSTLFGGAALADDGDEYNTGGAGGAGGEASAECLIPIGLSVGLLGSGGDVNQCNAAGGAGGEGGAVKDD